MLCVLLNLAIWMIAVEKIVRRAYQENPLSRTKHLFRLLAH